MPEPLKKTRAYDDDRGGVCISYSSRRTGQHERLVQTKDTPP